MPYSERFQIFVQTVGYGATVQLEPGPEAAGVVQWQLCGFVHLTPTVNIYEFMGASDYEGKIFGACLQRK